MDVSRTLRNGYVRFGIGRDGRRWDRLGVPDERHIPTEALDQGRQERDALSQHDRSVGPSGRLCQEIQDRHVDLVGRLWCTVPAPVHKVLGEHIQHGESRLAQSRWNACLPCRVELRRKTDVQCQWIRHSHHTQLQSMNEDRRFAGWRIQECKNNARTLEKWVQILKSLRRDSPCYDFA